MQLLWFFAAFLFVSTVYSQELNTPFEKDPDHSATYEEMITYYLELAEQYPDLINIDTAGPTDVGKPLIVIYISKGSFHENKKPLLFINNGIHPGEPCGIDASMMLTRDIILKYQQLLDSIRIAIIPSYNIGGMLNRNSYSRTSQNGPRAYGIRANAKNLDLNRDFVKADGLNTQSLIRLITRLDPDLFFDTHTTNGADYQHVMTLLATVPDKIEKPLQSWVQKIITNDLYAAMEKKGWYLSPYVFPYGPPENGIVGYYDSPRYSSGYMALRHIPSFITEAHMAKSFEKRVWSTYDILLSAAQWLQINGIELKKARRKAKLAYIDRSSIPVNYTLDSSRFQQIQFRGYENQMVPREYSEGERLYYDTTKPWVQQVYFYRNYKPIDSVSLPKGYIIPQAYREVIMRLGMQGIKMDRFTQDTVIEVEVYKIDSLHTYKNLYEGHYYHNHVSVSPVLKSLQIYDGDFFVPIDQPLQRLITQLLEPTAIDSYLKWNFFDNHLVQKEVYSKYFFEAIIIGLFDDDPELKRIFNEKMNTDEEFRQNRKEQLDFIFRHSPLNSTKYRMYPVYRLN